MFQSKVHWLHHSMHSKGHSTEEVAHIMVAKKQGAKEKAREEAIPFQVTPS